jgi:hypothetical protein
MDDKKIRADQQPCYYEIGKNADPHMCLEGTGREEDCDCFAKGTSWKTCDMGMLHERYRLPAMRIALEKIADISDREVGDIANGPECTAAFREIFFEAKRTLELIRTE